MTTSLAALFPIFLLIAAGWVMRRRGFPGASFWAPAERLTYFVLFPALLIHEIATADLGGFDPLPMAAAMVSAMLLLTLAVLALRRQLQIAQPAFTSVLQGALRFNTFVGLSAALALYNSAGVMLFAVSVGLMVPLVNVICVWALSSRAEDASPAAWRRQLSLIARNPLIVACLIGIAFNVTGLGLPPVVGPVLEVFGKASVALGLLAVGAALDLAATREAGRLLGLTVVLKLVAFPLLMALTCWAFGVEGLTRTIAILWAALPSSSAAYILARQLGGDAELMASAITATTVAAAVTMPLMLALLT